MNTTKRHKKYQVFEGKILGKYWNNTDLFATKLVSQDDLIHAMYELLSNELDLNDDGRFFLSEYWGLEKIAEMLLDYEEIDGDFHRTFKDKEEIIDWLSKGREYRLVTSEEEANLNIQNAFYKKYGGHKLGGGISVPAQSYYIADFIAEEKMLDFLVHLSKGMTYLTVIGYEFLEECYGIKYLAELFYKRYPRYAKGSIADSVDWFVNKKHSFIR